MPAITVENTLVLPRVERPGLDSGVSRPVTRCSRDYERGRLGTIPADQIAPRHFA